jgi:hypothetical protein
VTIHVAATHSEIRQAFRFEAIPGLVRAGITGSEPVHVRFAWHRDPNHNLYNIEKLPALPFRTDNMNMNLTE